MGPRAGTFAISACMLQRDAARYGFVHIVSSLCIMPWSQIAHRRRKWGSGWYFRHCGSRKTASYLFKTIERGKRVTKRVQLQ